MKPYYRIVSDSYAGYEVQVWRWLWPFWVQANVTNTHDSMESAEEWINRRQKKLIKYIGQIK